MPDQLVAGGGDGGEDTLVQHQAGQGAEYVGQEGEEEEQGLENIKQPFFTFRELRGVAGQEVPETEKINN